MAGFGWSRGSTGVCRIARFRRPWLQRANAAHPCAACGIPPRYRVFRCVQVVASFFAPLSLRERGRGEGRDLSPRWHTDPLPNPSPGGRGAFHRAPVEAPASTPPEDVVPRGVISRPRLMRQGGWRVATRQKSPAPLFIPGAAQAAHGCAALANAARAARGLARGDAPAVASALVHSRRGRGTARCAIPPWGGGPVRSPRSRFGSWLLAPGLAPRLVSCVVAAFSTGEGPGMRVGSPGHAGIPTLSPTPLPVGEGLVVPPASIRLWSGM